MERSEQRMERLERLVADLDARGAVMERPTGWARPEPAPLPQRPPQPEPVRTAPRISAPAMAPSAWSIPTLRMPAGTKEFEDLVGGRVLAWVGGLAVLLGLVFL